MKDVKKKDWDNLVQKDSPETSYEWFCFAEDIGFDRNLNYCNVLYKDTQLRGVLPAYYLDVLLRDFAVSFGFFPLGRFIPLVKTPFKVTEVRIPYSVESRYLGDKAHFYECLKALETFSRERGHSFLFMKNTSEVLDLPEYACIELFPAVSIDPYPSWDAYLESQKGKRGKHIRYEYKKSIENGTKTYIIEDLTNYYTILERMHRNVCKKNKSISFYPENYFKTMDAYVPQYTKCIFAENDGDIIGFLFLLENDHFIICKHAGRDYDAPDPYLYFRLLYELIKYSIKTKKKVSIEKATYDAKLRRGFTLIEKRCYIKSHSLVGDIYLNMVKKSNERMKKKIQRAESLEG
jgi:hypothetical protein